MVVINVTLQIDETMNAMSGPQTQAGLELQPLNSISSDHGKLSGLVYRVKSIQMARKVLKWPVKYFVSYIIKEKL